MSTAPKDLNDLLQRGGAFELNDNVVPLWPDPTPLRAAVPPRPFPVEALSAGLRPWVTGLAHETQTSPDLSAMCTLGALATACGGRLRVHVHAHWSEGLNLFLLGVQPSGTRKSPVFRGHHTPFALWEQNEAKKLAPSIATRRSDLKVAEQRLTAAESKQAKAENPDALRAARSDVEDANSEKLKAAAAVPVEPRLICADVTPEKLACLMQEQGGRMACWDSEAVGPFAIMLGRYSENGPNFEIFLKGHSNDPIHVDRIKRDPIRIEKPALTLVAMAQPTVLESLGKSREARGLGLLARILFFIPQSTVGSRLARPEPMSDEAVLSYANCINTLLCTKNDAGVIELAPEAHAPLLALHDRIEPQLGPGGDLAHIGDWAGKFEGTVVRIAGLLHAAENPADPAGVPMSADTVQRAIMIGDYLIEHALAAFEAMGAGDEISEAEQVLNYLRKNRVRSISMHKLHQKVRTRGRFPRAQDLEPVVHLLVEHGYLRMQQPPYAGNGRPPSPEVQVHPTVCGGAS